MASPTKWALITGVSAGGLGDAMAQAFISRGINVIASSPSASALDYLKPTSGSTDGFLVTLELDVTNATSIELAVLRTHALTDGRLDFLVNNAGYGYMMPLLDIDLAAAKKQFDVNVFGVMAVTKAFFPLLRMAKGAVVNQSSIAGLPGVYQPFIGCYAASKAALTTLSNTMRVELGPFDVKVVTLMTGDVKTEFWRNAEGARKGLPDTSIYSPIKGRVEGMMRGLTKPGNGTDRKQVADKTVDELLSGHPSPFVRRGFLATVMWLVSAMVPFFILDMLYWQSAEFGRLKTMLSRGPPSVKKRQ